MSKLTESALDAPADETGVEQRKPTLVEIHDEDLDGGGGTLLTGLEGTVRITGANLRALDIQNSPALEAIDLTHCRDDLRLHLTELPNLKWLQLPAGPVGATVELALPPDYAPVAPLVIGGPIADFGLCAPWLLHPFRLDRDMGERPIDGLAIGPPSANPPSRGVAGHLVVGRACGEEQLVMNCRGIAHLLVMGARLRDLELRNASLERLQISECAHLERIHGNFQARRASISVCRSLSSIGGSGRHLDLAVLNAPELHLEGRWLDTTIALADCMHIRLARRTRLDLKSLPRLIDIDSRAPYEVNFDSHMFGPNELAVGLAGQPGELSRVFERERKRFGDRSAIATHWMRHLTLQRHGKHVPATLVALKEVAANGVDREACWLIRCQFAAQRLQPSDELHAPAYAFRRGSSGWDWGLFGEADMTHWLDDLSLYSLCADLEVTAPFRRTLGRLDRLLHALLLAAALADVNRPEILQIEIRGYLRACLARLDLASELEHAKKGIGRPTAPRWFRHMTTPWWHRFGAGLGSLIESVGAIGDPLCTRRLTTRLIELGDAESMQKAAFGMHRVGLPQWQDVLVAGLQAPGEVPAKVYSRSMQLLLAAEPANETATASQH